jgi:hypothetical protein
MGSAKLALATNDLYLLLTNFIGPAISTPEAFAAHIEQDVQKVGALRATIAAMA